MFHDAASSYDGAERNDLGKGLLLEKREKQFAISKVKILLWTCFMLLACWRAYSFSAHLADDANSSVQEYHREPAILLSTALATLESQREISLKLEFEAKFFGENYYGLGRYVEIPSSLKFAKIFPAGRNGFELTKYFLRAHVFSSKVEDAKDGAKNSIHIVCDSANSSWWSSSTIEENTTFKQIDLSELWERMKLLKNSEKKFLQDSGIVFFDSNGDPSPRCGLNRLPGLGGLYGMFLEICNTYDFKTLAEETHSPELKRQVYKLSGQIKQSQLDAAKARLYVGEFEPYIAENIPTNVEILFPYPKEDGGYGGRAGVERRANNLFPCVIKFYSICDGKRNDIFRVVFEQSSDPIPNGAFTLNSRDSTYERWETPYLKQLIPGFDP